MKLKVKKLVPEATLPKYATAGSNGLDLVATAIVIRPEYVEIRTGISVEIPKGYVGLLFPRSSISKKNMVMGNSVGVIDSDYRGELILNFKVLEENIAGPFKYSKLYKEGERVGQLVILPAPVIEVTEVESLDDTKRGEGRFGSTGV